MGILTTHSHGKQVTTGIPGFYNIAGKPTGTRRHKWAGSFPKPADQYADKYEVYHAITACPFKIEFFYECVLKDDVYYTKDGTKVCDKSDIHIL